MSDWRELLCRVFDGEPLSDDEVDQLRVALDDEANWNEARAWLQFEQAATDHWINAEAVAMTRERLLARVVLRKKHAQIVQSDTHSQPAAENSRARSSTFRWGLAVAIALSLMVAAFFLWPRAQPDTPYESPLVRGDFRILGPAEDAPAQQLARGDRLVSGREGAQLALGGYCNVKLVSHSDVTVHGEPHRETIELHQGSVRAHVAPDQGEFRVLTPLGSVEVKGTEFETTVEYPSESSGDPEMDSAKKVVVTVAVLSGSVLCQLGDSPVLLEQGANRAFAGEAENRRTTGEVTALTDLSVTLKVETESITFHVSKKNKLAIREVGELLKGDRITVSWVEEEGRRWVRDIDGKGVIKGRVTGLGDAWIEVQAEGGRKLRYRAPWRGGNPADGGGPDRDVVRQLGSVRVGARVAVTWAMPEGKRVMAVEVLSENAPADQRKLDVVRSAKSGPWSDADTWQGGNIPGQGARIMIRESHRVVYDVHSDNAIRAINVAGTLSFATNKDTRLDVGLIKIQAGDEFSEDGFDCEAHLEPLAPGKTRSALEVGTPNQPVDSKHTALIRLVYFDGMDKQSCPAIVCCGGRMDFHGATMNRTWLKLGEPAKAGDTTVTLDEKVTGWRIGDRIILTATTRQIKLKKTFTFPSLRGHGQTEERVIKAIDGNQITLEKPLEFDHICDGVYRGDVANLSRNVVVESAAPDQVRGHTMYHRGSAGSISYAEFRHLGKPSVLGRYSLHYHLVGDTMRGSSVIGASIWDSGNRWLTIHGTNYLVVRDCVGYQSQGHGFFMEDGTEVYNVLDRNLAVQGFMTKPLPKQVLPFDSNDGAGFWWANCLNTFTRNVAAECDEYGFRFEASKTEDFDPVLSIRQPDGKEKKVDIRTLPFIRFDDNEAHCQRRHSFNLGGFARFPQKHSVDGVGPDEKHPFVLRNTRAWNVHWPLHSMSPCVMLDGYDIWLSDYEIWRMNYDRFAYRGLSMKEITSQPGYLTAQKGTKPKEADFPGPLNPVDDLPPITVITHVEPLKDGKLSVRGTTSDNGEITRVVINGKTAKPLRPNFAEWQVTIERTRNDATKLTAHAEDAAGNVEQQPHVVAASIDH